MALKDAGKRPSYSTVVVGAGLIVALVDSFLPWRSATNPPGYGCDIPRQCAAETAAFNGAHGGLVYWPGWVFLIAVIVGLALLSLRTLRPHLTISPMPSSEAPVYAGIGAVMLLCAGLQLLTGVGSATAYYETAAGGVYTVGPGVGVFIGTITAVVVGVGGYWMRAPGQPTASLIGSRPSPATPPAPSI